jgi:hypothetical protein
MNLNGIQTEEPAGIGAKAMIAEADWDVGGILMTELLKGEMYLEIKIEINDIGERLSKIAFRILNFN